MQRSEAWDIVCEYVQNQGLRKHMLCVEAAMRAYAEKYHEDRELWGNVGLLHDFDWEIHPTLEGHPQKGSEILKAKDIDLVIIRAILSHAPHTGVTRDSLMEKALFACDELTGLITAATLVRPDKSLFSQNIASLKKKFKTKAFAANVNREEIELGAKELGVDLWSEHAPLVLDAMREIADELGLK